MVRAAWLTSPELRSLLQSIVRTTAASSCVLACADSHERESANDSAHTSDAAPVAAQNDAAAPVVDASPAVAADASRGDAGRDAARDAEADAEHWDLLVCAGDVALPGMLSPALPTSYLSVQTHGGFFQAGNQALQWENARVGTTCSGASDMAECERDLNALLTRGCVGATICRFALTGSQGSAPVRIDARSELLSRLGAIDVAAEAVVLAAFDGHGLCMSPLGDARDIGTEIQQTNAGFLLRTRGDGRDRAGRDAPRGALVAADGLVETGPVRRRARAGRGRAHPQPGGADADAGIRPLRRRACTAGIAQRTSRRQPARAAIACAQAARERLPAAGDLLNRLLNSMPSRKDPLMRTGPRTTEFSSESPIR